MLETRVNTKTHCSYCGGELSWIKKTEDSGCRRCLNCHPIKETKPEQPKEKPKLLDVKFTEMQIREIVRNELENWHIHKPPVTRDEIAEATSGSTALTPLGQQAQREGPTVAKIQEFVKENPLQEQKGTIAIPVNPELAANPNWRAQAKKLGIPLFQRKKEDVLKDIESRLAEKTTKSPIGG